MKLSQKIPLIILLSVFFTGITIVSVSFFLEKGDMINLQRERLLSVVEARATTIDEYIDDISRDLDLYAHADITLQAIRDFTLSFEALKNTAGPNGEVVSVDPVKYLQDLYINEPAAQGQSKPQPTAGNTHPLGKKENFDYAKDGSLYSELHKKYHDTFRQFLRERGYYDIFLISKSGDIVYSVFKERDYATNLNTGEWKDTGLAEVFNKALTTPDHNYVAIDDIRPYKPSADAPASFVAHKINNGNGEVLGVIAYQIPVNKFVELLTSRAGLGKTGRSWLGGEDFTISGIKENGTPDVIWGEQKHPAYTKALKADKPDGQDLDLMADKNGNLVYTVFKPVDIFGIRWVMAVEMSESEALAPVYAMLKTILILLVVVMILINVISYIFTRKLIVQPIQAITEAMYKLESGNKNLKVPHLDRKDEIGVMAHALESFKRTAIEADELSASQKKEEEIKLQRAERIEKLIREFDQKSSTALSSVSAAARQLFSASDQLVAASARTGQKTSGVVSTAEQTLSNVRAVAAAAEELSASISEISSQVMKSANISNEAVAKTQNADGIVQQLSTSAQKIGDVVSLISDIADQINLLALNATIESARAGEAGKGFAVVASEVKTLASQTTKATGEIATQISEIQDVASGVVKVITEIRNTINEISQIATMIASAVEEQSAATQEIARNIQTAATGVQSVTADVLDVKRTAADTDNEVKDVNETAKQFSVQSDTLQNEVTVFLQGIRAS